MLAILFTSVVFAEDKQEEIISTQPNRETYDLLADEIEEKASSLRKMLDEMDAELRNSMATIAEIESVSRDIGMLDRTNDEVRIKKDRIKELKLKLPQTSDDFYSRLDLANDKAARIRLLANDMRDYCRRNLSRKEPKPKDAKDWQAVQFKGF